jgi:alcohol dehydrogenase
MNAPLDVSGFVQRSTSAKVVFGAGAVAQLGPELAELGVRRPMLVASRKASHSSIFREAAESLRGFESECFDRVPEHSSLEAVAVLVDRARAHRADGFIAIGGGSASDTAKAAAIWLAEGGRLEDHASRFTPPAQLVIPALKAPKLPIASVPCTASGAEMTSSLGIRTASGTKLLFWDPKVASRLVLIDPVANVSIPAPIMLSTGMNGLAHCVEGLYSRTRTPVTDALALHAIPIFAEALPRVAREPDSVEARARLLVAAHLAGLVLANARTCLHHAICHALGAVTGVPHGAVNAVILPHAMGFNRAAAPDAFAQMARTWPGAEELDLIERVRALQAGIGVPARLRDLDVPRAALADVAAKTMGERGLYFNPRTVSDAAEIEALLGEAW